MDGTPAVCGSRETISRQGRTALLVAGLSLLSLGCVAGAGPYPHPSRIAQGAILGSMTGAAIGAGLDHHHRGRGAIIGAVGGLLAGALLGGEVEAQEGRLRDRYAHAGGEAWVWCEEHRIWERVDEGSDWQSDWEWESEPREEPDPEPAPLLTTGPRDVLFDPGSAELTRGAKSHLQRLADRVRRDPDLDLLLRGHTDGTGQESFALSEERARSVRAYLTGEGVAARRIAWVGFGDTQPIASTRSPEGRQRNRRVEIVLRGPGYS
jgi:outer membrane protein OmpA-like peptidoglycan-associated protein